MRAALGLSALLPPLLVETVEEEAPPELEGPCSSKSSARTWSFVCVYFVGVMFMYEKGKKKIFLLFLPTYAQFIQMLFHLRDLDLQLVSFFTGVVDLRLEILWLRWLVLSSH